jgi:hypothetical protein
VVGQLNFLIEINYQKKFGQYFALLTWLSKEDYEKRKYRMVVKLLS